VQPECRRVGGSGLGVGGGESSSGVDTSREGFPHHGLVHLCEKSEVF